jgi:phospholipase C
MTDAHPPAIEHVVVLALENRSFDHMLGYVDHPNPKFDGLVNKLISNPGWEGDAEVPATPEAKTVTPIDPDHSHGAAMEQLGVSSQRAGAWQPDNSGFVSSLERKGRGLARVRFSGRLAGVVRALFRPKGPAPIVGLGKIAMRCQPPENVPVLSTLATEFAVCTRWFSSLPGETWPNRNFMHAATSDGETNIEPRFYGERTIFEVLESADKSWHIYHDDTPQIWAFEKLWEPHRIHNWYPHDAFAAHVETDQLPVYSFLEPNHRPVVHTLDHLAGNDAPDVSTSQHPGNSLVSHDAYDAYPADEPSDFVRGEQLIAWVYETLRGHPEVFEKTLLLITYDEHGGFFDHVPPPTNIPAPRTRRRWFARLESSLLTRANWRFDFTMLGPRVPAVIVSPYIGRLTVDTADHDHACIPATLRALFVPDAAPLTERDDWAAQAPFHTVLSLTQPRRGADLPDLSALAAGHNRVLSAMQNPEGTAAAVAEPPYLPTYFSASAEMTERVAARLQDRGARASNDDPAAGVVRGDAPIHAFTTRVTNAFQDEARASRDSRVDSGNAADPYKGPPLQVEDSNSSVSGGRIDEDS